MAAVRVRLGPILGVLAVVPAVAQTPGYVEHRQDVATIVTSEVEAFTGHVEKHCGIFTLQAATGGPPAAGREEVEKALKCVRDAQRRGQPAWAVWQVAGVDATLFVGVAASSTSSVHLVQSAGNVDGVTLTPCLRPRVAKNATVSCATRPPRDGDLERAVERLRKDVARSGVDVPIAVPKIRAADGDAALDHAVDTALDTVHAAGDGIWPRCPRHFDHPLAVRDGWWFCDREKAYIVELGNLWRVVPRTRK
jgi:hypothetical protein